MKKILFIILALPFISYGQECTKMVNGVKMPCTQQEINQRAIDSVQAVIDFRNDSISNTEAARIRQSVILINGTPYNQLTNEQRNTIQLYLLMRTGNLNLVSKTIDFK